MIAPRSNSAAADRSAVKATPPAFAPHPGAPFPGNGFRLFGGDVAPFSSIAVAAFADGSTGAEASDAPSSASAPASAAPLFRYSPGDESGAVILSEATMLGRHFEDSS